MGFIEKVLHALIGNPYSAVAIVGASGFYAMTSGANSEHVALGILVLGAALVYITLLDNA